MSEIDNQNYRDTVFRMLFNNKKELLKLYNALNETSYENEDDVIINTIGQSTFMKVKNDISFIFDYELNLFEHQSTPCPNMPLRDLFYVATLLKKITSEDDVYSRTIIKIPAPRFYVFYNGTVPMADREIYRLSEQFEKPISDPDLELVVTILNVNEGHNSEIMKACETLKHYSIFVSLVRKYIKEIPKGTEDKDVAVKNAISRAINKCIEENILTEFFETHRAKVVEVCMWDYNEQLHEQTIKKESYEDGFDSGFDEAKISIFNNLLAKGFSESEAKELTSVDKKTLEKST